MSRRYWSGALTVGALAVSACNDRMTTQPDARGPELVASRDIQVGHDNRVVGGVFTATNATGGNAVVAFARHADGSLSKVGQFSTGGTGIGGGGDPLQSQGSVVLRSNHRQLFVVNAGSNTISTFALVDGGALRLTGTVSSRGAEPISIATTDDRLYVLNADNTVSGFALDGDGAPRGLEVSHLSLGLASDGPSTINASRDGRFLFVTQRAANRIDVIHTERSGSLSIASRRTSSGSTPFGFAVTVHNQLIVTEAAGDAPNGATSSYTPSVTGSLTLVSASVSTHQAATCWVALSRDGRFAFTANAGGSSITGYSIVESGALHALTANGRTGVTNAPGSTPLDLDVSLDGRFLYALQTGNGTIGTFAIGGDGHLATLPDTPGLSAVAGFQGLAAY